jgi:PAS domain S-box-containing protein
VDLYRSFFDLHPDGIVLTVDGKIALVNARFEEMIGHAADELTDLPPTNFVVAHERERATKRMLELLQGGSELQSDYSLLCKDGSRVDVDVRSTPIQHEGKPAVLSIVREVSNPGFPTETLNEPEEWAPRLFEALDRLKDAASRKR